MALRGVGWLVIGGLCGWVWARRVVGAPARPAGLTDRQAEILSLVGRGLSTKEISRREGLSPYSVETHIRRARRTLGVTTRAAAAAAVSAGSRQAAVPARPRRSATPSRAATVSATSSSNGT